MQKVCVFCSAVKAMTWHSVLCEWTEQVWLLRLKQAAVLGRLTSLCRRLMFRFLPLLLPHLLPQRARHVPHGALHTATR
jgi:hypothetical protein